MARKTHQIPMAFTMYCAQAEKLDRPSESLRLRKNALVRDAVNTRCQLYQEELAAEEVSEQGRPKAQGRGRR